MPSSSSSSAQQARQALADQLRDIRLTAGLTGRDLAARAGWHGGAKVSKIEHGTRPPSADFPVKSTCRSPSHYLCDRGRCRCTGPGAELGMARLDMRGGRSLPWRPLRSAGSRHALGAGRGSRRRWCGARQRCRRFPGRCAAACRRARRRPDTRQLGTELRKLRNERGGTVTQVAIGFPVS